MRLIGTDASAPQTPTPINATLVEPQHREDEGQSSLAPR